MSYIVVGILVIVCAIGFILFKLYDKPKRTIIQTVDDDYDLKSIDIHAIDRMAEGSDFEMYIYRLLLELGYTGVYKTTNSRDFGADVVFNDREGIRNVVQTKKYSVEYPVGISAVQEVFSCMRYYKAKKAIVIASAKFTEPCETLAGINNVKLLDRTDLIKIIDDFRTGDLLSVKDRIEAEPRMILESWSEAGNNVLHEIRKDYKAEKFVQKVMGK